MEYVPVVLAGESNGIGVNDALLLGLLEFRQGGVKGLPCVECRVGIDACLFV